MTERWRLCTRNPRYQVSDQGRVKRTSTGRIMKPSQNSKQNREGYLHIALGDKVRNCYVHQLVAEAFLGPCPLGKNVDHIDHDRLNNAVTNLRYLPKLDNSFRWKGRDDKGRNQWESPYLDGEEPPEDHAPLTEEEEHELQHDRVASGW